MRKHDSTRRGYALLMVLFFVVLFLALLGVAWRRVGSALRIETVRAMQVQRDESAIHALARALKLLESGVPATSPYVCGVTMNTSTGPRDLTVTFTQEGGVQWAVHVAPTATGESPAPMPSTFATVPR